MADPVGSSSDVLSGSPEWSQYFDDWLKTDCPREVSEYMDYILYLQAILQVHQFFQNGLRSTLKLGTLNYPQRSPASTSSITIVSI
jgi:hypothetical protein